LDIAEGRAALDKRELDEAAAKFRHALELQPESSDAQHFLGVVLEKEGDARGASAAYRKAVELNPGDVFAREKAAARSKDEATSDDSQRVAEFEDYIRAGRFKEVDPLLAAYVKEHPNNSWGWYALGYSLFAQQKIGESIRALAKSLELDRRNAEAHKNSWTGSDGYWKVRRCPDGIRARNPVQPASARCILNLGKLFSIQDNWSAARKNLKRHSV